MLQSVMLDNKYDRFVKNRRTGKLDTKGLHKVNTSSRLFKRREARKNKHYAVSIVVDVSGSMIGDGKIQMAAESARKISMHLSKIEIPHNIVTFNVSAQEIKPFNTKYDVTVESRILSELRCGALGDDHHRYIIWDSALKTKSGLSKCVGMYEGAKAFKKAWDDFMVSSAGSGTEMDYYGSHLSSRYLYREGPSYNSDAETVKFVRELMLRKEGRRVVVLLSDGQPAPVDGDYESPINPDTRQDSYDLRKEIDKTINAGVELYSIGMLSDAVKNYYPPRRCAAINDMKQLYPHIIKMIRLNLKRG